MDMCFSAVRLRADLADLDRAPLAVVKRELQGERAAAVHAALRHCMLEAAAAGAGVPFESFPAPLLQSGPQCQSCALLNGIAAAGGRRALGDLPARIEELRRRAVGASGGVDVFGRSAAEGGRERFMMDAVAQVLCADGVLAPIIAVGENPAQTVRRLFVPGRFMGVSAFEGAHAVAWVPLAAPRPERFAAEIDSLTGMALTRSVGDFLALLTEAHAQDFHRIYQTLR